ncbi:MAG: uracil-DNA glycosylase [candidate division Zixibacteria bacterium]|nr:uracil-DNA glycosylase [candidate division Zixibacteria bacterium]
MGHNDELKELYDLARRAMECQADLGHREIIFEAGMKKQKPIDPSPKIPAATATTLLEEAASVVEIAQFAGLEEHRAAICDCHKCPLGDTRTKFVYGVGNPQAKIMFIGEAPGRDEDLQGEPFVGRAGKLLDKILVAIGFARQDVYIANILKCRPPNNRDPQPDEMHLCIPYLKEQIRLIHPQMICALGRIASHGLLETTTPLGRLRKVWHRFEDTPLLVTYHPAALLRFPEYKRDTWEDMQLLKAEYDRINAI